MNVRLTEAEHAFFAALSEDSGRSVSALLRGAAQVGLSVPTTEEASIRRFHDLVQQFARVGNNLNQLARRANRGHLVMTDAQAEILANTATRVDAIHDALLDYQRLAQVRDFSKRIEDIEL